MPPRDVLTHELARELTEISHELNRRVGLLVDRAGRIEAVAIGSADRVEVPRQPSAPSGRTRFCTLRWLCTRFGDEPLGSEDLAPLALHRLDALAAIPVGADGLPGPVTVAHLLPARDSARPADTAGPAAPAPLPPGRPFRAGRAAPPGRARAPTSTRTANATACCRRGRRASSTTTSSR